MVWQFNPVSRLCATLRSVRARLASQRGDTLVEALMALLIAALGAALLATMVAVSSGVTAQTALCRMPISLPSRRLTTRRDRRRSAAWRASRLGASLKPCR